MSEALPSLPRLITATVARADRRALAAVAKIRGARFPCILFELEGPSPVESGELCEIEMQLCDQLLTHSGIVRRVSASVATTTLVSVDLDCDGSSDRPWQQRRASYRHRCHSVFRANASISHPLQPDVKIPSIAKDLSISGVKLEVERCDPAFQPGLHAKCVLSLPCSSSVDLNIRVCDVRSAATSQGSTLHCCFVGATDDDLQKIVEHIVRFGSSIETLALLQSRSVRRNVAGLLSFDLESGPELFNGLCRALDLEEAWDTGSDHLRFASVRLGLLPVAAAQIRVDDQRNVIQVSRFLHRPEAGELRGIHKSTVGYVESIRESLGAASTSGCSEWQEFAAKVSKQYRWPVRRSKRDVSWSHYALSYDVMCRVNPAYHENIEMFRRWLSNCVEHSSPNVLDLGAGTGNYVIETARELPEARIFHLERDPVMNLLASEKYRREGVRNVSFLLGDIDQLSIGQAWVDVAIMVNMLYSLSKPYIALKRVFEALRPGGLFFLIDLGREMDVRDWSQYIANTNLRSRGVLATIQSFYQGRHAITQNRAIRRAQDTGTYWKHSPVELTTELASVGFEVLEQRKCYRGYCDNVIGRRPH